MEATEAERRRRENRGAEGVGGGVGIEEGCPPPNPFPNRLAGLGERRKLPSEFGANVFLAYLRITEHFLTARWVGECYAALASTWRRRWHWAAHISRVV